MNGPAWSSVSIAAAQVAMLLLKMLLLDEQEAFEVIRESSIENRALGME